jgi:putative ABC transport system ATP-binding protein
LSVIENVILPCKFSKTRRDRALNRADSYDAEAIRLLNQLGIEGKALLGKPVTDLSVGQQQRVAAARALIGTPEIIIADEPTSSLDANYREVFIQLLFKECDREKTTLVFVSHDTALENLFDRTIRLADINALVDSQTVKASPEK